MRRPTPPGVTPMPGAAASGVRHLLATAALGPLLLPQGLHVRRVTPRLPEPPGPRSGCAGQGDVLRLLVAGDSAAAGVGAASQDEAVAGRLVAELSVRRTVDWRLEARTGYTTAAAHAHLAALPEDRFDVVVLSLGVNDVTRGVGRARWLARQSALADMLQARFAPRAVLFTALPPMHLRCRSRCAGTWVLAPATSTPRCRIGLRTRRVAIWWCRISSRTIPGASPATASILGRPPTRRGRYGSRGRSTACFHTKIER